MKYVTTTAIIEHAGDPSGGIEPFHTEIEGLKFADVSHREAWRERLAENFTKDTGFKCRVTFVDERTNG